MGIGFLAKDNTGIPSFRFTSLEAAPCPEDGPCAGMEGENLEYCNHFVDGCMAHLPPDDHQHHHHDDHSAHDDGHDDDHHYDDDHDDYEDEDRVACDSNDDCNGGFCNFDNGDLGFCEPCYHFGSVEECKNSGLPDAGADACVHRCFDGGEHIKLNAAEKKKMENYRAYKTKKAEKKKHLKLSTSAQHHGERHEKSLAASKKSVANEKDKLEEKEAQLEKSVHDKQQRQRERAIQVSKYLKEKKAAKKEKEQMKK